METNTEEINDDTESIFSSNFVNPYAIEKSSDQIASQSNLALNANEYYHDNAMNDMNSRKETEDVLARNEINRINNGYHALELDIQSESHNKKRRKPLTMPNYRLTNLQMSSAIPNQNMSYHALTDEDCAINMNPDDFDFLWAVKLRQETEECYLRDKRTNKIVRFTRGKQKSMAVDNQGNENRTWKNFESIDVLSDHVSNTRDYLLSIDLGGAGKTAIDFVQKTMESLGDSFYLGMTDVSKTKKCDYCKTTFSDGKAVQTNKVDPKICCNAFLHPECVSQYFPSDFQCPHSSWNPANLFKTRTTFTPNIKIKLLLFYKSSIFMHGVLTMALIGSCVYNFYLHRFDSGFSGRLTAYRIAGNVDFFTEHTVIIISDVAAMAFSVAVASMMYSRGMPIELIQKFTKKDVLLPFGVGGVLGVGLPVLVAALSHGILLPLAPFAAIPGIALSITFIPWNKLRLQAIIVGLFVFAFSQILTTMFVNSWELYLPKTS